jgi:hypothetical protein
MRERSEFDLCWEGRRCLSHKTDFDVASKKKNNYNENKNDSP